VPTRRTVLKLAATSTALAAAGPLVRAAAPRVVVIGAGAFGGWTAYWLARGGASVTLLDAWGPGNMRASSGGETRVIRGSYGDRAIYTKMAARALRLWREAEREWNRRLYVPTGALWMFGDDDAFARESEAAMRSEGLPFERPSLEDARRRWPQIDFAGVRSLMFEREAGYLLARQSCGAVVERAQAAGAVYRLGAARPVEAIRTLGRLPLGSGDSIAGDAFVFACGPWLGQLFPDVVGTRIKPTRQETFYFGPPAGDTRFDEPALPVWVDFGERLFYGVPGNAHRGFKIADDSHGPAFDPTSGERELSDGEIAAARAFIARRFPALANAPLLGGEVCQYENSPDSHLIIDRHPAAANVWIVGGGSGHGFKMGPALGELVAGLVLKDGTPDPHFRLSRFKTDGF
jgi:glycine/D-amino acid oxidase-like deaminating enzyme